MAAPTGQGLPELEEALLLQAEMMELQVCAALLRRSMCLCELPLHVRELRPRLHESCTAMPT